MRYVCSYHTHNCEPHQFIRSDVFFSFEIISDVDGFFICGNLDENEENGRILSKSYPDRTTAFKALVEFMKELSE